MIWYNWTPPKTIRNKQKQEKNVNVHFHIHVQCPCPRPCPYPCPRPCPLHKSALILIFYFGLFQNGSEPKQTDKFIFSFTKKTATDRVSVRNQNKKSCPWTCTYPFPRPGPCPCPSPCQLHKSMLIFSFGLFRNADFLFGSFWNGSETPKQSEKYFFSFAKRTKQNRNRLSFGLFRL